MSSHRIKQQSRGHVEKQIQYLIMYFTHDHTGHLYTHQLVNNFSLFHQHRRELFITHHM